MKTRTATTAVVARLNLAYDRFCDYTEAAGRETYATCAAEEAADKLLGSGTVNPADLLAVQAKIQTRLDAERRHMGFLSDKLESLLSDLETFDQAKTIEPKPQAVESLPELLATARELAGDVLSKIEDAELTLRQATPKEKPAAEKYARAVATASSNAMGGLLFEVLDPLFSDFDDDMADKSVEGR